MKGSPISVEALKEVSEDYIFAEIPTRSGVHFITRPFNTKEFGDKFPDVAVHKNSMGTVLYIPSSVDRPKYCCSDCGGTNIQVQAWVDANTNMYCSDITDNRECWCEDCETHTLIKEVKNEKTDTDS